MVLLLRRAFICGSVCVCVLIDSLVGTKDANMNCCIITDFKRPGKALDNYMPTTMAVPTIHAKQFICIVTFHLLFIDKEAMVQRSKWLDQVIGATWVCA